MGAAQSVKSLLTHEHKDGSLPRTHVKALDTIVQDCNSSAEEAETHSSVGLPGQPCLLGKYQANERPCVIEKKINKHRRMAPGTAARVVLQFPHTYAHVYPHKHILKSNSMGLRQASVL